MENIDYRVLLIKYIKHIKEETGSTSINVIHGGIVSHIKFTDQEVKELEKLGDLINDLRM